MKKLLAAFAPLLLSASLLSGAAPAQADPQRSQIVEALTKYVEISCNVEDMAEKAPLSDFKDRKFRQAFAARYLKQEEPEAYSIAFRALKDDPTKWSAFMKYLLMELCDHQLMNV